MSIKELYSNKLRAHTALYVFQILNEETNFMLYKLSIYRKIQNIFKYTLLISITLISPMEKEVIHNTNHTQTNHIY